MARVKMCAHRCLIGAALLGFFCASSGLAYQAAGAAVRAGSYLGR